MASKIFSAAMIGLDAVPITVEADVAQGLPNFIIVGLPDASVKESRERVRTALKNSGLPFPRTRLTVNLAPADIRKEGPSHDLSIAVALLEACGAIPFSSNKEKRMFFGELGLDGSLRPVSGSLSVALMSARQGFTEFYLPVENAIEAACISGISVFPVENLPQLVAHFVKTSSIAPLEKVPFLISRATMKSDYDFSLIRGQQHAKRALEIAAAGGHNVLLSGPPGSGKTLLAQSLSTILPIMTEEEVFDVTKIYSVSGLTTKGMQIVTTRPFRSPHHTASGVALIGGGSWPKPGEVSLAHRGVLFLDEFPEFSRSVLENLRQPLEDGYVTISRAKGSLRFPAKFILVAAQNPCPCGFEQDKDIPCTCTPLQITNYRKKISGPLLDRIDLHVEVPKIKSKDFFSEVSEESSASVRDRVQHARDIQYHRFSGTGILTNAEMNISFLKRFGQLDCEVENLLQTATDRLHLSARAITRVIKLARTIADLDKEEKITPAILAEALHFRERNH